MTSQRVLELVDRLHSSVLDAAAEQELARELAALEGDARTLAERVVLLARERAELRRGLLQTAKLAEVGLSFAELVHELRQPLSSISGFAQLLGPTSTPKEVGNGAREILTQCSRMEALLERLRRFLKTEDEASAEKIVDVSEALRFALSIVPKMPPGVVLDVQLAPDLGRAVGEQQPLVQIIVNLLANAREAQAQKGPGTVCLRASREDQTIAITVADEGVGIPPDFAARLFEPFATTKGEAGTGLGLYICRETLAGWDAQIALVSPPPRPFVTAFAVRLRSAEPRAVVVPGGLEKLRTEIALRSSSARAPRRVLIVDDEAAVRRVLRVLLSAEDGVELREAKDGPEALKLLLAQPVQVLVVDRSLPGMTGLEIVRRALSDGRAEEALVVTGYPSPTSVAEAINAGACGYLVKPIEDAERLRSLVRAALERARLRQVALALGNDLRPWAERALAAGRDAAASRTLLEALQILSSRPEGPARIGVVAERALVAPLALAGQRAEGPWDRSQALAETKSPDVEALVVGEGLPPAQARELVRAVQAQPWPKAVVWAQPAGDFDDALALLHAGVAAIVERPVDATALAGAISRAVDERRRSLKVRALSVVLAELGIQGEAVKAKQAVG